jgi:glutamyl-tRNA reductase
VREAAVISTCNRFEILLVTDAAFLAARRVTALLAERASVPPCALRALLLVLSGDDAAWHVLRVAAGLDSLVVGEAQILAQMKRCRAAAVAPGAGGGKVLGRLLAAAVHAGKRARSETDIARGGVSVSSAAVELVQAPPLSPPPPEPPVPPLPPVPAAAGAR